MFRAHFYKNVSALSKYPFENKSHLDNNVRRKQYISTCHRWWWRRLSSRRFKLPTFRQSFRNYSFRRSRWYRRWWFSTDPLSIIRSNHRLGHNTNKTRRGYLLVTQIAHFYSVHKNDSHDRPIVICAYLFVSKINQARVGHSRLRCILTNSLTKFRHRQLTSPITYRELRIQR